MFEHISDPRQVLLFPGRMPVSHRYTAGLAGERFFRALGARGVFLASSCGACGVTYCPARAFCERCLAGLDNELEVGPGGTLESFTVVHVDLDGGRLDPPVVIGLVRLDGADTCLVHRVDPALRAELQIGARVEAVLEDAAARCGHLDDIRHFTLA